MIEVRELRVGNYVSNNVEVVKLTDEDLVYLLIYDNQHKAEPIPLTEKWLIDFGFEKHKANGFWFMKNGICISVLGVIELISWDRQAFKLKNEIKHVHQLQNLYFALTGEELTL